MHILFLDSLCMYSARKVYFCAFGITLCFMWDLLKQVAIKSLQHLILKYFIYHSWFLSIFLLSHISQHRNNKSLTRILKNWLNSEDLIYKGSRKLRDITLSSSR